MFINVYVSSLETIEAATIEDGFTSRGEIPILHRYACGRQVFPEIIPGKLSRITRFTN